MTLPGRWLRAGYDAAAAHRTRRLIVLAFGVGAALIVLGALYWLANLGRGGGCHVASHAPCDGIGAAGVGGPVILVIVLAGAVLCSVSLAAAALAARHDRGRPA